MLVDAVVLSSLDDESPVNGRDDDDDDETTTRDARDTAAEPLYLHLVCVGVFSSGFEMARKNFDLDRVETLPNDLGRRSMWTFQYIKTITVLDCKYSSKKKPIRLL